MINEYGRVVYTLFEHPTQDGDRFTATAIDEFGNEYEITWKISGEDEWGMDTYDFDAPVSVILTEETPVKVDATYEDPEGEWEIIAVDGKKVKIKQIQKGNINYGSEACVDAEEAWYFLTHGYPWEA